MPRLASVGVVFTACWIGLAGVIAPPAGAASEPAPPVLIVIDELTPLIPGPDDTLRITGRVISQTRATLSDVSIQLRHSATPLAARADVSRVAGMGLTPTDGDPDAVVTTSTTTLIAGTLAPGTRTAFAIEVPIADLGLATPGTYVLGLEVLGLEIGIDEFEDRKGVLRTFLPWYPTTDSIRPMSLVWLWPLADWPARTASGALLNDRTPIELSRGGRLDRLVAIGSRFPGTVSWIADPSLLQTASDMTGGYEVLKDGAPALGDREAQAGDWLATLKAAVGPRLRVLPYADVDAAALTRAEMPTDVVRAITEAPGVASAALGAAATGDLYWAPFGRIDRATADVLSSAGVGALILSSAAMPATDPTQPMDGLATATLPTSSGSIRAVLTDPGLSAILGLPQRTASDVILARQRFLAETALISGSLPADQPAGAVVVAPGSVRWDPTASLLTPLLRATRTAPWLSALPLEQLLIDPVTSASRQRGGYGTRAREAELTPQYMAMIRRTAAKLNAFTAIVDDPAGISESFSAALLRSESSAWRSNPSTGRELLTSIDAQLETEMSRVRILSEGTITLSGDTGRVPVTIANDLDRSVTVGLALRGNPALRLESEPLASIRIEPGTMASVDIAARVIGGEPLTVDIQLLTPEGKDYGDPTRIQVSSAAYARAASWVVVASFAAIVIFVIFGVTRRIHKARTVRPDPDLGR